MYLKMLNMDNFVRLNGLKEVTDPIYLEHGRPTPEGLFSYEIFGISQYDRQTIWAYIDLGAKFLHPLAAINFKKYGKKWEALINGVQTFKFVDGDIVEDPDGDTGIDFLYEIYDKIKWKDTSSITSSERINFLKQGKNRIFIDKFPIIPPFYRDINENTSMGIPEVNDIYKKILSQVSSLKNRGSFSFFGNLTRAKIQSALVELHQYYIMKKINGKSGILRKYVMGRNIDDAAWLVLSSPKINCETYKDMTVDFDHCGYPLAAICSMGRKFIVKEMRDFFDNEFLRSGNSKYVTRNSDGEIVELDLIDPASDFSDEFINKQLKKFVNGYSTRFECIPLPRNKQGIEYGVKLTGRFGASDEITSRPMTWTDLIYLCAYRACKDKYVIMSRYPIEELFGIIYIKPAILTTNKTIRAEIDGVVYPHYPLVEVNKDSSNSFVNTLSVFNPYLKSMGGDYDGDSSGIGSHGIEIYH